MTSKKRIRNYLFLLHFFGGVENRVITGCDSVFILETRGTSRAGKTLTVYSKATDRTYELEAGILKPLLKGSLDIKRYAILEPNRWVLFPYWITKHDATLLPPKELAENYPRCWDYLKENKKLLESREHGRWRGPHWYTFSRIQNLTQFDRPKILTPSIANSASFACDMEGKYYFVGSGGGGGGGYGIILKPDIKLHPYYVTALLNTLDSLILTWLARIWAECGTLLVQCSDERGGDHDPTEPAY